MMLFSAMSSKTILSPKGEGWHAYAQLKHAKAPMPTFTFGGCRHDFSMLVSFIAAVGLFLPFICFTVVFAQQAPSQPENPSAPQTPPYLPAFPPEINRQIEQFLHTPPAAALSVTLTLAQRLLLVIGAGAILFVSLLSCRYLNLKTSFIPSQNVIFLLFGLSGALAALLIASALTASLYLHVAAAVCVVLSGFSLAAFLVPQFNLTRRWLLGRPAATDSLEKK